MTMGSSDHAMHCTIQKLQVAQEVSDFLKTELKHQPGDDIL